MDFLLLLINCVMLLQQFTNATTGGWPGLWRPEAIGFNCFVCKSSMEDTDGDICSPSLFDAKEVPTVVCPYGCELETIHNFPDIDSPNVSAISGTSPRLLGNRRAPFKTTNLNLTGDLIEVYRGCTKYPIAQDEPTCEEVIIWGNNTGGHIYRHVCRCSSDNCNGEIESSASTSYLSGILLVPILLTMWAK